MIPLDSSFIVAHLNEADSNHCRAVQEVEVIEEGRYGSPAITDYIFDEIVTVMLTKTGRIERVSEIGEKLLNATVLIRINEELFNLSWRLSKEQEKPLFSFADCSSIAACNVNGISNIATFDEDFKRLEAFNITRL